MTTRLDYSKASPEGYKAFGGVYVYLQNSGLSKELIDLVYLRVSQINGCAFCIDMHARDLRKHGETWQRINNLPTWREVSFYSPRERAALAWAETLTRLAGEHGDHDAAFTALQGELSEQEIVDLTWVVAQINAWNRMAVGMRQPPSTKPLE